MRSWFLGPLKHLCKHGESLQQSFFVYEENGNIGGAKMPTKKKSQIQSQREKEFFCSLQALFYRRPGMSGPKSIKLIVLSIKNVLCLHSNSVSDKPSEQALVHILFSEKNNQFRLNIQGRWRLSFVRSYFIQLPVHDKSDVALENNLKKQQRKELKFSHLNNMIIQTQVAFASICCFRTSSYTDSNTAYLRC